MNTEPLNIPPQSGAEWLPPTAALTRFHPPKTEPDTAACAAREATVIGFHIGSLGFLLPPGAVCELLEPLPVHPLPMMPPWFSGLLNLRGQPAPVIDLRALCGATAHQENDKRYLLALGRAENTVALWIDGMPEMLRDFSAPLNNLPSLATVLQRYVSSGYLHRGRIWLNVQFDELFMALANQYAN